MNYENLYVAGGVGFNLVCNGRLFREGMFDDILLPLYPGDNGISVCFCANGLFRNLNDASSSTSLASSILLEANHEYKDREDLDNDKANDEEKDSDATTTTVTTTTTKRNPPPLLDGHLSPYLGTSSTNIEMAEAIQSASLRLNV